MKYDSTHGKFKHSVTTEGADTLVVNGSKIKCIAASREGLNKLPWGAMGADTLVVNGSKIKCIAASRE